MKTAKQIILASLLLMGLSGCDIKKEIEDFQNFRKTVQFFDSYDQTYRLRKNEDIENERTDLQARLANKDTAWESETKYKILREIIYNTKIPEQIDSILKLDTILEDTISNNNNRFQIQKRNDNLVIYFERKESSEYLILNSFQIFSTQINVPYGLNVGNSKTLVEKLLGKPNYYNSNSFRYIYPKLKPGDDVLDIRFNGNVIEEIYVGLKTESSEKLSQTICRFETGMID